jgi:hypothetical protein
MATESWAPSSDEDLVLSDQLAQSVITCPRDFGNRPFLPLNKLDRLVTELNVTTELQQFMEPQSLPGGLPSQVVARAKKVFAILVMMGESSAIKDLLEIRLEDDYLPVSKGTTVKRQFSLKSSRNGAQFLMPKGFGDAKTNIFVEKQWLVQAPVWTPTCGHLSLDPNCPLPFYQLSKSVLHGGSNAVYQCMLHGWHQRGFKVSPHLPTADPIFIVFALY